MIRAGLARSAGIGLLLLATCALAAVSCAGKAEEPKDKDVTPQESAFSLYRKGIALYRRSLYDDAAPLLAKAAELKPNYLEAHFYAGKCYLSARKVDLEAAEKHLLAVVALKPDHINARMDLARTYFAWGRYEDARKQVEAILEIVPKHKLALYYAGTVAARTGNYEDAVKYFRRTLEEIPDSLDTWVELGDALSHLGREDEALEAYQSALELRPGQVRALMGAGTSLQRLGREEEAKKYLVQFKEAQAAMEQGEMRLKRIRVRVSVAKRAYEEGRIDDGRREESLFVKEFANDPDALTELGAMQASLARVEDAEATFKRVIQLAPAHRTANEMLMELYRRIGENAKANAVNTRYKQALQSAQASRPN